MIKKLLRRAKRQVKAIPASTKRVPMNTPEEAQKKIWQNTVDNIICYMDGSRKDITKRLEELENEWDIERVLATNAAALVFLGAVMSFRKKSWMILPLVVGGFLLQHGVQGWCPPLPLFRSLGVRTAKEIYDEYAVLRRIRGDFGKFERGHKDARAEVEALLKEQDPDFFAGQKSSRHE